MSATAAKAEIGHNSAAVGEMLDERPAALFDEPSMLAVLIEEGEKSIAEFKYDLSTDKGRKAIASFARKFATRKTALDEAGKEMNSGLRKKIDVVDEVRRKLRDHLDKLRDKARAPLDAWEKKEDDRKQYVIDTRNIFADAMSLTVEDSTSELDETLREVEQRALHPEMLGDLLETARAEQQAAVAHIASVRVRIEKAEADRRELERLRAKEEETARLAREAAAKEAAEKAEQERIAAAAKAAAEKAIADERRKAEEAAAAVERERAAEQAKRDAAAAAERKKAQDAIDEANRKARAAEEALEAERRAEAAKVAAAEKAKAEQARLDAERQRNQEHRQRLMKAAKEAIMEHGDIKEDAARLIVLAIVAGSVPNVSLEF